MEFGLPTGTVGKFFADDFYGRHFDRECFIRNSIRQVSEPGVCFYTTVNYAMRSKNCRYGRRTPLVAAVFIQLVCGVCTAITPWFWLFCFLRFFTAVATGGTMTTRYRAYTYTTLTTRAST